VPQHLGNKLATPKTVKLVGAPCQDISGWPKGGFDPACYQITIWHIIWFGEIKNSKSLRVDSFDGSAVHSAIESPGKFGGWQWVYFHDCCGIACFGVALLPGDSPDTGPNSGFGCHYCGPLPGGLGLGNAG
jgi:hypothetical protein